MKIRCPLLFDDFGWMAGAPSNLMIHEHVQTCPYTFDGPPSGCPNMLVRT